MSSGDPASAWKVLPTTIVDGARARVAYTRLGDEIFLIGGDNQDRRVLDTVLSYNYTTEEWTYHPSLLQGQRCWSSAVALDNERVVVVGGYPLKHLRSAVLYNTVTKIWSSLPPMRIGRQTPAFVAADNKLYAIGGCNPEHDRFEDSVEVLEEEEGALAAANAPTTTTTTTTSKWRLVPSGMRTGRTGCAAVFHERSGCIVITGGYNDIDGHLNTCEIYDVHRQVWKEPSTLPPMSCCRAWHSSVIVQGTLLVVMGGKGHDETAIPGVEMLNLDNLLERPTPHGASSSSWIRLPPMNAPRYSFAAYGTTRELQIIVAGGLDGTNRLDTMEILEVVIPPPHASSNEEEVLPLEPPILDPSPTDWLETFSMRKLQKWVTGTEDRQLEYQARLIRAQHRIQHGFWTRQAARETRIAERGAQIADKREQIAAFQSQIAELEVQLAKLHRQNTRDEQDCARDKQDCKTRLLSIKLHADQWFPSVQEMLSRAKQYMNSVQTLSNHNNNNSSSSNNNNNNRVPNEIVAKPDENTEISSLDPPPFERPRGDN